MNTSQQLAKHCKGIFFGGNWTDVNFKDALSDVSFDQANKKVDDLNTIATLVYHMGYFVPVINRVLEGGPLDGSDKHSWKERPFENETEWNEFIRTTLEEAEKMISLVVKMPAEQHFEVFRDERYGNYYDNIHGFVQHTNYHLGQISLLKKLTK